MLSILASKCYNLLMKYYTSCFLGIPLPQEYKNEFGKLLINIKSVNLFMDTVHPHTPHITIYYLDKQSQFVLGEISKLLQSNIDILSGTKLKIKGFDYFTNENLKVLFLDINYSASLMKFNKKISKILRKYNATDNGLPFHPHLTVGRIKNKQKMNSFYKNKENVERNLSTIDWNFQIMELALYGVDSTKSPEHQEKLITIPVDEYLK